MSNGNVNKNFLNTFYLFPSSHNGHFRECTAVVVEPFGPFLSRVVAVEV